MNLNIHGDDRGNRSGTGIASSKYPTVRRAIAHSHDPFRIWRGVISALQGLTHILCHRPRHEQYIGMARRRHKAQAKPLEIVERIAECMNLKFAAIARAGVYLADGEGTPQSPPGNTLKCLADFRKRGLTSRYGFGEG